MAFLNRTRYGFLGYLVWQAGKWYLRRRAPSKRTVALAGVGALGTVTAAAALGKRLNS